MKPASVVAFAFVLVLALLFCAPRLSSAVTLTVCETGCEYATISSALQAAQANDIISVGYSSTPYTETTNNQLSVSVTLLGGEDGVIVEGPTASPWLTVASDTTLALTGSWDLRHAGLDVSTNASVVSTASVTASQITSSSHRILVTGYWSQKERAVTLSGTYTSLEIAGKFTHESALSVSVNGPYPGLYVNRGQLISNGTVSLTSSGSNSKAIYVQSSSVWYQTNSTVIAASDSSIGYYSYWTGRWSQSGQLRIELASNSTGVHLTGPSFLRNCKWLQNAPATIDSLDVGNRGVFVDNDGEWTQSAPVNITASQAVTLNRLAGSSSNTAAWFQFAKASLYVDSVEGIAVFFNRAHWQSTNRTDIYTYSTLVSDNLIKCNGSTLYSQDSSAAMVYVHAGDITMSTNAPCKTPLSFISTVNSTTGTPKLTFNATAPSVQISPKSENGTVVENAAVAINMARLSELSGSTIVRSAVNITENGAWAQLTPDPQLGSSQTFVFNSSLAFDDVPDAQGRVEIQFDLFDRETNVSLGNLTAFAISPNYAKLTLRVIGWPFSGEQHRLEVRLDIDPAVSAIDSRTTGANGVTVFKLSHSNDATQRTTEIRVVDVVEIDSVNIKGGGAVKYDVDVAQSQLVLSFAHFESSLVYDPDFGVLLGGRRDDGSGGGGGGGDSSTWIIGVAVAIPLAIGFVIVVILIGTLVGYFKHKRNKQMLAKMRSANVNFAEGDHPDDNSNV